MSRGLPAGRLLAYYGDDFTGSTDVMEVMAFNGLATVLFLQPPTPAQLARFAGYRGIGIAGVSRSRSPRWMEAELPSIFRWLHRLDAPLIQYKVCSTLDSAPQIGSIGKAVDLAQAVFASGWVPLVIAAPRLRRFQVFGNLFAVADGTPYRLDRHPTMSRHPVTPMTEADVRRHLGAQTARQFGLVSILDLQANRGAQALQTQRTAGAEIVAIDVLDDASLAAAGRLVWEQAGDRCFSASSSGLQYALVAYWRQAGLLAPAEPPPAAGEVDQMVVVSGSCAPATGRQIDHALAHGFGAVAADPCLLCDPALCKAEQERAITAALGLLEAGASPLVYTARGPDDPSIARFDEQLRITGLDRETANERVGRGLGRILARLQAATGLRRVLVAGGDTSGYCSQELGIYALTALTPIAPGSPLCLAHAEHPQLDQLQIALKGGQVGNDDYFLLVRRGCA